MIGYDDTKDRGGLRAEKAIGQVGAAGQLRFAEGRVGWTLRVHEVRANITRFLSFLLDLISKDTNWRI